jgi:CBS domain-containing protein
MKPQEVDTRFEGEGRRQFMRRLLNELRALEQMIRDGMIESGVRRIGAEQEMFLVDRGWRPAPAALQMLEQLDDPHFVTEFGLFNLEVNIDPSVFGGDCLRRMERQLDGFIAKARAAAQAIGLEIALTGILPTIRKSDLTLDNMTPKPRYQAINDALTKLRGSNYEFHIKGIDELLLRHDSAMVEAANTSFQLHFQVAAHEFANLYNVAQVATAPVLAVATNSPLLFGKRLWAETRIALFQQAVDTRTTSLHMRESSPRVTFGSRWVRESVLELYREDVARFRTLIGTEPDEDPFIKLNRGIAPELKALRLHNGTVYRWNRPCYGILDGKPHLRIENRVMPAGPSVVDELANATFWYGMMSALSDRYPDITAVMEFEHAQMNFVAAARQGLSAQMTWLEGKELPVSHLILDHLLPQCEEALERRGIDGEDVRRYLEVIERRVRRGKSGSRWLMHSLATMKDQGTLGERLNALTAATIARQKAGQSVAEWEPARLEEAGGWQHNYCTVEQFMTTDLYTVREDEPIDLAANLMEWERIRHIPVEDHEHRLVGLMSYRHVLRVLAHDRHAADGTSLAVAEVMKRDLITVTPDTPTLEAIALLRKHRIGCLPVVHDGRLVGIVTEDDFMDIARELLEQKLREQD